MLALARIFDLAPAAPMAMRRRQRAVGWARRSEEPHRALLVLARSWPLAGTAGYLDAVGDASWQLRNSAAPLPGRNPARRRAWPQDLCHAGLALAHAVQGASCERCGVAVAVVDAQCVQSSSAVIATVECISVY